FLPGELANQLVSYCAIKCQGGCVAALIGRVGARSIVDDWRGSRLLIWVLDGQPRSNPDHREFHPDHPDHDKNNANTGTNSEALGNPSYHLANLSANCRSK